MKIEEFRKYLAIFKPKIVKDLRPEVLSSIGKKMIIRPVWIADKEYTTGKYVGQWVMSAENGKLNHYTSPEEDFEIIEKIKQ